MLVYNTFVLELLPVDVSLMMRDVDTVNFIALGIGDITI